MRTSGIKTVAAVFLLSSVTSTASAGLINSSDAVWAGILDFATRCGTVCPGDAYEVLELRYFDVLGEHGFSYARQSGGTSAFTSVYGSGAESSADDYYELQLTVTQSVFASTAPDAHPNAYSYAASHFHTFFWGFDLNQSALFTGTLTENGLTTELAHSGTIYDPGFTELFGLAAGDISTPRFIAGQFGGESSVSVIRMRLDAVAVPTPGTLILLAMGLAGIGFGRRWQKR
jgi:hypothetical protein